MITAELVLNKWEIRCAHTPETIDRIVMNFRKRSMCLSRLDYKQLNNNEAVCTIEFEDTEASSNRIYSNMLRIVDIEEITRL